MDLTRDWPGDADGDVFRRLVKNNFDFSKPHSVDYNVDFRQWPPSVDAVSLLRSMYGEVDVFEPDEHGAGYLQFRIVEPVRYESVVSVQHVTSKAIQPFGGVCESWGVMQDAP